MQEAYNGNFAQIPHRIAPGMIIEYSSIHLEYDHELTPMSCEITKCNFFNRICPLNRCTTEWYLGSIRRDILGDGGPAERRPFALPHCSIRVNDPSLFVFLKRSYDCIDLVFGQDTAYWKFSRNENGEEIVRLKGDTTLSVGTCPCCIQFQYRRVLECIRRVYEAPN